jgi:regulator of nonsense transcripts 2
MDRIKDSLLLLTSTNRLLFPFWIQPDTPHFRLMMLLEQELPECHSREKIDEITEKFCSTHGSSKNSRKRLLNALFHVPHTRLDLLPYYSRMTATLDRIWVDIATSLITDLEQQFHGQAKFKKNLNLDSRMKTARYIGELTKFRVAPPIVALRCFQRCMDDFTGSNVDVACCLLEVCGRYLYRMKHTSQRIVSFMDTMTRLSKAKVREEENKIPGFFFVWCCIRRIGRCFHVKPNFSFYFLFPTLEFG